MRSGSASSCSMSLSRSVSLARVSKSPVKYNNRSKSASRRRISVSRDRSSYSRRYSSRSSSSRWSSTYSRSSSRPRSRYRDRYSSVSTSKSYSVSRSGSGSRSISRSRSRSRSRPRSRSRSYSYSSSEDSRRYRRDSKRRHRQRDSKYSKSPVSKRISRSRDERRRNGRDVPKRAQPWVHAPNKNQHRRIPSRYDIDKRQNLPRDNKYSSRVKLNGVNSIPVRTSTRTVAANSSREYKRLEEPRDYVNEKQPQESSRCKGIFRRLDRSLITPFLLRVYAKFSNAELDGMQVDDDADGDGDKNGMPDSSDELQIYLWPNSNLRDLVNLIKDTCPRSRLSSGIWVFKRVRDGKILDDFAQVHAYIPSRDDFIKICHLGHIIGDALYLTID